MKNKILEIYNKAIVQIKPFLVSIDEKISSLIPNPKIKKIAYIGTGSLFGFMFLIIILGILISPFRNKTANDSSSILKKPNIIVASPEPQKELTESQKTIIRLGNEVKNITFPDSMLNLPVLEKDLSI